MADVATVRDSIKLHLLEPAVGTSEGLVKAVSLGDNRQHTPPGGDPVSYTHLTLPTILLV